MNWLLYVVKWLFVVEYDVVETQPEVIDSLVTKQF